MLQILTVLQLLCYFSWLLCVEEREMTCETDFKSEKLIRYEQFLNETLRSDLKCALDQRDKLYSEIAEHIKLQRFIERIDLISNEDKGMTTQVDLGCNFFVKAKITDTSKMMVKVGMGFCLEMSHKEALGFLEKKIKLLEERVEERTVIIAKIKAHIKLMLEGIREIQNISDESCVENSLSVWDTWKYSSSIHCSINALTDLKLVEH